ncbi:MAG: NUDIX domain-containing protein [Planctomycetes bacterium]|nr:NUDIX domain-containing protein [Planctomycetota bacterium]
MSKRARLRIFAAGIIEHTDHRVLIAHCGEGDAATRLWHFPWGAAAPGESPEAAMRRIGTETLGVTLHVAVGQPPVIQEIDGESVEVRYFLCTVAAGTLDPGPDDPFRWESVGHLREYEFEPACRPVVQWLLEG